MRLVATTAAAIFGASILTAGSPIADIASVKLTSNSKHSVVAQTAPTPPAIAVPTVPPPDTVIAVQSGDYLTKVADENGTTAIRLFYANTAIVDPDLIYPGQSLTVPTANETLAERPIPVNTQIVAPTTAAAPSATTQPAASASASYSAVLASSDDTSAWDRLAACEAGGNWSINTGNGFYGGLQFTLSSWQAVGGSGLPSNASRDEQIARGQMLQARQGWGAWPACSYKAGLR